MRTGTCEEHETYLEVTVRHARRAAGSVHKRECVHVHLGWSGEVPETFSVDGQRYPKFLERRRHW